MNTNSKYLECEVKAISVRVFDCVCSNCRMDLSFDVEKDSDGDLRIEVKPCECIKGDQS